MPENEIDEIVASAYGLASFHLQNAILTTLVAKGHLTMKEAALTIRGAHHELEEMKPTPMARELKALALQALKTLSEGWDNQAKGN
jgi:hypothetical protein